MCDPLFLSSAPNEDYRPVNTIVEFGSSQSERCVDVRIINDTQVEQSESFDVSLTPTTNLDDRIILVQDSAKVIIRNDDGKLISKSLDVFTFLSLFLVTYLTCFYETLCSSSFPSVVYCMPTLARTCM